MKTLRFAIAAVAVAGSVSAFATNARVESMGKKSMFIMDDISIFDNPANISLYPNFLIGELGNYVNPASKNVKVGENHDPWEPWFGGIFSLSLSQDNAVSIAGVLNRKEERLMKYFPTYITKKGENDQNAGFGGAIRVPETITNFDGFLGANFSNTAVGAHIYVAHQDGLDGNGQINSDAFVSALQGDLGANIEISSDYAMEIVLGLARIQYGPTDHKFFDDNLFSGMASARLFSKITAINGHLIPVAFFRNMKAPGRSDFEVGGGMGVDAAFDRGFFWMGLDGFYNKQKAGSNWVKDPISGETMFRDLGGDGWGSNRNKATQMWQLGGTISFGIERNIWWDWFVLRVGGQKTIAYVNYNAVEGYATNVLCPSTKVAGCVEDGNYFVTNPVNDGTRGDNVGFGFGINVEEKLKVDATVAEDLVFRNPFQGEGRLISRISATYSF